MILPQRKIASFCKTGSGGTPSTKKKDLYYNGKIPWVKSGELQDDFISRTLDTITEIGLKESSAKLVPKGAILIAMYGATVGKTAMLGIEAATNQAICNIIPDSRVVDSKYLWYALRAKLPELLSKRVGGAQPNINQQIVRNTRVLTPSITEQHHIVEILEQADGLRKQRAEADAKAARILPALFYKIFGDPSKTKNNLPISKLVTSIKRRNPSKQPNTPFNYIDIAGVDGHEGIIKETKALLGQDAPSRARQIVNANDILISTVRPYLRATALVPRHLEGQICSTGFCVLRAVDGVGYGFLYTLSRLEWFTQQLNSRAKGASYPAVTENDILNLQVPDVRETGQFKKMDVIVSDFLFQKNVRKTLQRKLESLFEVVVHRAFSGDLTANWREAHLKELLQEMEEQSRILGGN